MKLDLIDYRILTELQRDATLSSSEMASLVGVSQTPTWRRMTQLDETGVIQRRVAIIDRSAVSLDLIVHVFVRLKNQTQATVDAFRSAVSDMPEIVQCHMLMGDIDFLLQVVTKDLTTFHRFIREDLSSIAGVSGLDSRAVVEETKNTTALPLHITEPRGS
jgi:Lrp/AsnC family transcriptional regulator